MIQLLGALLIVVGLASIFAKDLLWELTVFSHRLKGSSRSALSGGMCGPRWEVSS